MVDRPPDATPTRRGMASKPSTRARPEGFDGPLPVERDDSAPLGLPPPLPLTTPREPISVHEEGVPGGAGSRAPLARYPLNALAMVVHSNRRTASSAPIAIFASAAPLRRAQPLLRGPGPRGGDIVTQGPGTRIYAPRSRGPRTEERSPLSAGVDGAALLVPPPGSCPGSGVPTVSMALGRSRDYQPPDEVLHNRELLDAGDPSLVLARRRNVRARFPRRPRAAASEKLETWSSS